MTTPAFNQSKKHIGVPTPRSRRRTAMAVGGLAIAGGVLGACTSSPKTSSQSASVTTSAATGSTSPTASLAAESAVTAPADTAATTKAAAPSGGAVLPVTDNPIVNKATAKTLKIASVLVENNVDANGRTASDHLEIALKNAGTTDATEIEVFYTFTDPASGASENYYTKLPADFVIPAGGTRVVHFDATGAPDHFPVNKFSLYYTNTNAMEVSVIVSANNAAVQKFDLKKDAGGPESAD